MVTGPFLRAALSDVPSSERQCGTCRPPRLQSSVSRTTSTDSDCRIASLERSR